MAQRRQPGQAARQIVNAGTLAVGAIECQRFMIAALQDGGHQARQAMAGTDFEESADAGFVQTLDLADELDWTGQLSREQIAGAAASSGYGSAVLLAKTGIVPRWNVACLPGRRGTVRRRRRRADCERPRTRPRRWVRICRAAKAAAARSMSRRRSGKHGLLRSVLVGENEIEILGAEHSRDRLRRRQHGEHGSASLPDARPSGGHADATAKNASGFSRPAAHRAVNSP